MIFSGLSFYYGRAREFFSLWMDKMFVNSSCRLVEEVKEKAGITLENEDVYMNTSFNDFIQVTFE